MPVLPHNGFAFLWGTVWNPSRGVFGAAPFIAGTLITALGALLLATIIGVPTAVYLVEIAPPAVARPLSYMVELLAAIPSVVYGLWGITVLGAFIRDRFGPAIAGTLGFIPLLDGTPMVTGLLAGILVLTIMIVPTITSGRAT